MPESDEPAIHPKPSPIERSLNRALQRSASVLTSTVALLLILFVVLSLVGIVSTAAVSLVRDHDFAGTAVRGLDGAFLVIILLELVHTTLSRESITTQIQEFLVIGITSGVRSGLEVAVNARERDAHDTVVNLAINAFGVLALVVALWVGRRLRDGRGAHASSDGGSQSRNG